MLNLTRERLDKIDEWLSELSDSSEELATVLCALRGNDVGPEGVPGPKMATMLVRRYAFPRLYLKANGWGSTGLHLCLGHRVWGVRHETEDSVRDTEVAAGGYHFEVHVNTAMRILGLLPNSHGVWKLKKDEHPTD